MSNTFTLDDIRAAAEAKYGSVDIPLSKTVTVKLINPLRLSKENRKALMALQDQENSEGEKLDEEELLSATIRLVADTPAKADKLLAEVNGDLAVLAEIVTRYTAGAQVGEASPSQD